MARFEPTSNAVVATVDLGAHGYDVALIDSSLWVSVEMSPATGPESSFQIDPTTNRIDRTVSLETGFWSLLRHQGLTSPRWVHRVLGPAYRLIRDLGGRQRRRRRRH